MSSIKSVLSERHSIPSAPCPTAGKLSSGLNTVVIRSARPSRFSPAAARIIAAYCPSSNLRNRVCTLPRNGCTCK